MKNVSSENTRMVPRERHSFRPTARSSDGGEAARKARRLGDGGGESSKSGS